MTWTPIDLAALDETDPIRPTIGGIVYPGKVHLWSGEPETAKTLAAHALAVDQIRAGAAVAWIDFEMGARDTLARLRDLGLHDEELERFLYFEPDEPLTQPKSLGVLDQLLGEWMPSLVVIDSYTPALELHGCHPNEALDIERFKRTVINPLRAHGAAVNLIDHVVKNADNRGKFSTGSERKLGVCDVHLGFEAVRPLARGGAGLYRLSTHKDRGGFLARPRAGELEIASDETGALTWGLRPSSLAGERGNGFRPTVLMERVSRYLEAQSAPVSQRDVQSAVTGKSEYVSLAIEELYQGGNISKTTGARGAYQLASVKPFREADCFPTDSPVLSVH